MDGVFMTKFRKWISALCVLAAVVSLGTAMIDRHQLNANLIRLHIVAQSDSKADQDIKLSVRDTVMAYLKDHMGNMQSCEEAEAFLKENTQQLENAANECLKEWGAEYSAKVSLQQEAFDVRHYDTFSLPSGVYRSLRIELGAAEGKNWWCVVFPSLCMQASGESQDVSVFSDRLTGTIEGREGYALRFLILDWLGEIEKLFFRGE